MDDSGRVIMHRGGVTADLRGRLREHFLASDDLKRVRFSLRPFSADPWLVDLTEPSLGPSPSAPADLRQADIKSLNVTNWEDKTDPKIDGIALTLDSYETSRSLAILPNRQGLILGADFGLRRFDAKGKKVWEQAIPGVAWGVNMSKDGRLVVAAYDDGTLRWHRTSDGEELLAFFIHVPENPAEAKRWVAWTRKGYYTASPNAEELIGWHVNRGWDEAPDFFPADRFRNQFNRPDIVRLVLDTLDEEKAIQQANVSAKRTREAEDIRLRQPPVVTITSPRDGERFSKSRVSIDYSVRSPSGLPIRRVWALVDGREADTTKGLVPVAPAGRSEVKGKLDIDLPARDVTVAVLAETDQGLASVPAEVRLAWAGGPAPRTPSPGGTSVADLAKPRLFALLVGVAKYKDRSIPALNFAAKDVRDVAAVLSAQKERLYSEIDIRVLTDAEATATEIRKGLGWIARAPSQSDVAIVYVSGHGVTDETGDYQFLPHDAEMDSKAPIWAPIEGTAVPHSDFTRALKRAQRAHTFFMFDTCHAGDVSGGRFKGAPTYAKFVNELTSAETGVRVLASSEGRESSLEHPEWQNGAFTKAVVDGLKGAADVYPKDGVITADELSLFVKRRVQELTRNRQHPVTQNPALVRDIPVATLR
jgi:hypothetical protein